MRPFRLFILIYILTVSGAARAQMVMSFADSLNSEAFWKRIKYVPAGTGPVRVKATDTFAILITNRKLLPTALRYAYEDRDTTLHLLLAISRGNTWIISGGYPSLSYIIAALPFKDRDWVVYADGFGKTFPIGLDRGLRMAAQHRVGVIYLDYPSYNSSFKIIKNYYFASHQARMAGRDFAPVLDTVMQLRKDRGFGSGQLTLFFHSMGNYLIREMVRGDQLVRWNGLHWVDNMILNAPSVPERGHARWVDQIRFARRIYVHYNPQDHVLQGAHLVSVTKQLGERVKRPLSRNAVYVNFSTLSGAGHNNFMSLYGRLPPAQEAVAYYHRLLHGENVLISDPSHFRRSRYHHIGVDILGTPGNNGLE